MPGLVDFFRRLGGQQGAQPAMQPAGGLMGEEQPRPDMFGRMTGGVSRFNENHPGLVFGAGQLIAGNDMTPAFTYADERRKDKRTQQAQAQKDTATKRYLVRQGYTPEEADEIIGSGNAAAFIKPPKEDNTAAISAALESRGVPKAEIPGIIAAGAAAEYFKPSGGDATSNIKEYQYAVQNGMFNGSFTDWQTKGVKDQDPNFIRERDLRSSYEGLDVVKGYNKMRDSYERIRASASSDSGPGDIGLIFNYMKMLDPGSVVRENEFATASNSGGVDATIRNLYNGLMNGERLTPEQRQQFIAAADSLYGEASQNLGDTNERYTGIATDWKLEPNRIVVQPEKYEPLQIGQKRKMPDGTTIERVD